MQFRRLPFGVLSFREQAVKAKEKGLKKFKADRPCERGHYWREVLHASCIECNKRHSDKAKNLKTTNPERHRSNLAKAKRYRDTHKEEVRKRVMDWHKRNPEKLLIIKNRFERNAKNRRIAEYNERKIAYDKAEAEADKRNSE